MAIGRVHDEEPPAELSGYRPRASSMASENTALHSNTTNTIYGTRYADLSPSLLLSPSLSTASVTSYGGQSSATTPLVSNVTTQAGPSAERFSGPHLPSIPSVSVATEEGAYPAQRRRESNGHHQFIRDNEPQAPPPPSHFPAALIHSPMSKIKMNLSVGILVLGLLISSVAIVEYFSESLIYAGESGQQINNANITTSSAAPIVNKIKEANRLERFDELKRYIINDYDAKPPFSNFLPAVAGIYGKPLWSFYVNRGQGISSFGVKSKDYPLMEFFTANEAYQNTHLLGFRTFYQGYRNSGWGKVSESFVLEPFDAARSRFEQIQDKSSLPSRQMYIGSNEVQIREVDHVNRIETNVTYFTLPEENFGAFVRRTTIANTDKDRPLYISILDGLARMQPAGGKLDILLKTIGRTLEGYKGLDQADHGTMPFYRMSTEPSDAASVVYEEGGHFLLSFNENERNNLLPIVYDTSKVFGEDKSLSRPVGLYSKSIADIVEGPQYGAARTSSAFAAVRDVVIYPGESITLASFYGKARSISDVPVIARRIVQGGFARYKLTRARELITQITASVETRTASKAFNAHVQQMYLDNSLRGGVPVLLGEIDDVSHSRNADEDTRLKPYHLFSRIHGDLERDYNFFVIDDTYFSEGPGNFRDVAQNRRNDVIFNPRIGSFVVKQFFSFVQFDGYNPLSVESIVFNIYDRGECDRLATIAVGHADGHRAHREALAGILCDGSFRPGQLADMIERQNIFLIQSLPDLIDNVAASSTISPMAVEEDGFWADHFTYLLDLLDSYLKIYPDKEESLLFDSLLPYYFSTRVVRPRSQKYVLSKTYDGTSYHVRQLKPSHTEAIRRQKMEKFRNIQTGWYEAEAQFHHDHAKRVIRSSIMGKLFLLVAVKFASRDPAGMGIEYEGGKPGWNDAMNGLVGMLGSGLPETYELLNLLRYVRTAVNKFHRPIEVPKELAVLIHKITIGLDRLDERDQESGPDLSATQDVVPSRLFDYWDFVSTAREQYRGKLNHMSGDMNTFYVNDIMNLLDRWTDQVELGIARANKIGSHGKDESDNELGISPTYFAYNVSKWQTTDLYNDAGHPFVRALEMRVIRFPLFLEGVVRKMKTIQSKEEAAEMYSLVYRSGLRDPQLGMYAISSNLKGQSFDIGRVSAFAPGWLENQSIWTHMAYKYYLELLRKGLHDEFFTEMRQGMLPFFNDTTYGRSILECSSFIASSSFEDPSVVGQGFLPRLSGSTAEFMSIWTLMMIGPSPFFNSEEGNLVFGFKPSVPSWLLRHPATADGFYSIQFKFFTSIDVVYYTKTMRNLYGTRPQRYTVGLRDGSRLDIDGATLPSDLALRLRRVVFVQFIHAYF